MASWEPSRKPTISDWGIPAFCMDRPIPEFNGVFDLIFLEDTLLPSAPISSDANAPVEKIAYPAHEDPRDLLWMISRRRWGDGGVQGMIRMQF